MQADALDAAPPSPATKQHLDRGVMAWRSVFFLSAPRAMRGVRRSDRVGRQRRDS